MMDNLELAAVIKEMLLTRAGLIITPEVASERANNIAAFILAELETLAAEDRE